MLVADNIPTGTIDRVKHVINFLAKQGKPAYDSKRMDCKYRLGDTACAVGCLIPDSKYEEAFEYNDIHDLVYRYGDRDVIKGLMKDESVLVELQIAHDGFGSDLSDSKKTIEVRLKNAVKTLSPKYSDKTINSLIKLIDSKDWSLWKQWDIARGVGE